MKKLLDLIYNFLNWRLGGAIPDPEDARDLRAEEIMGAPTEILPKEFQLSYDYPVKNQRNTWSCFPGKTPILMGDFLYKPINEVYMGDEVITHTGQRAKVIQVFKRIWQGNLYKIRLWGDYREIEATPEHPFLAIKRRNHAIKLQDADKRYSEPYSFVQAKELKKGDWLAYPINNVIEDKTLYSFERDPDFLWILGLYLAEGNIDKFYVQFSLHRKEFDWYEKIKRTMARYGTNVTFRFKGENSLYIYIMGKRWCDIFTELGNKLCDYKQLNKRLMVLDPILQSQIIKGYIDGDGHIDNGAITMVSTSYNLLVQIKTMLLRNYIFSSLQKRKKRNDRKQVWVLEYSQNGSRYSFIRENYIFVLIKSITKSINHHGNVFNLEVEPDNSYIVNGVAVHNCVGQAGAAHKQFQEGIELSARYLYKKCKLTDGYPGKGTYTRQAVKMLVEYGDCEENLVPQQNDDSDEAFLNFNIFAEADVDADIHRSVKYISCNSHDLTLTPATLTTTMHEVIKRSLWNFKQPIVMAGPWFSNYYPDANGVLPLPSGYNKYGHAFLCVGWDKENNLICVNSWGKNWGGMGGWFKLRPEAPKFDAWTTIDLDAIKLPKPEIQRDIALEQREAKRLQTAIYSAFAKYDKARSVAGKEWLILVNALCYKSFTTIDLINYVYAKSRNKPFSFDITKSKDEQI